MTPSRSGPSPRALAVLLTPLARKSRKVSGTLIFVGAGWIVVFAVLPMDLAPEIWILPGVVLKAIGFLGLPWSRSSTPDPEEGDAGGG